MWRAGVRTLCCVTALATGIAIVPALPQNASSTTQTPPLTPEQQELDRLKTAGDQAYSRADLSAATNLWQEGLNKAQALKDEARTAKFLNNLGNVYDDLRQFDKALDYGQRALDIRQTLANQQDIADSLYNLGNVSDDSGQLEQALGYHNRALGIYQKLGSQQDIAGSLCNLGAIYDELGQFDKALDYGQRALEIRQTLGNQRAIARSLNNLGNVYHELGQFEKAFDFLQRALDICQKLRDQPDVAMSLNNLGGVYVDLGQFDKALDHYQRALDFYQKLGNQQDVAMSLNNLGGVFYHLGQYDQSLDFHQRALDIYLQLEDQPNVATCLNNVGATYDDLGQFDKTLNYFQRALDIRQKLGNQQDIAASLSNLGAVYDDIGQLDKALDYHQRALDIRQKLGNQQDIAHSLNNLGSAYHSLGQLGKALDYHQRALEIRQKQDNRQDIAGSLNNLGNIYEDLGQFDKAFDYHQRALDIRQKLGNQQDIAHSLSNLGKDSVYLNQLDTAEKCYSQALVSFEQVSHQVADPAVLGNLQQTLRGFYERYAHLLLKRGRAEDALTLLERGRTQGLARQIELTRANLAHLFTSEEARQLTAAQTRRAIASRRLLAVQNASIPADPTRQAALDKQLHDAEHDYDRLHDRLSTKYPQFRQIQGDRPPTIADIKGLAHHYPDTLYLEYAVVDDKTTLLFALLGQTVKALSLAVGEKTLNEEISQWCIELIAGSEQETRYARQLYQDLLQGIDKAGLLAKAQHVVIVASGPLVDLPFSALLDRTGHRLVQRLPISSALSLGTLLWPDNPHKPSASLLCVADPIGKQEIPRKDSYRRGGFGPLPMAREEGKAIAALFAGATLLVGPDAREAQIKSMMGHYALLHFATHGYLDTRNGMRSALILAPEPQGSPLAGVLDAREIVETGVAARLAVLSACETAQGQRSGGEGLLGLVWAFRAAGCPAIVASEWKVPDDSATQDLMVGFYRGLKAGKRKDEALRAAMLAVKARRPEPFYWAAFQMIGDTSAVSL